MHTITFDKNCKTWKSPWRKRLLLTERLVVEAQPGTVVFVLIRKKEPFITFTYDYFLYS